MDISFLDITNNAPQLRTMNSITEIAIEAKRIAEELTFYMQMEEMLQDIGADYSAYTKLKEELLEL